MKPHLEITTVFVGILLFASVARSQVTISEFMAVNDATLADQTGDYHDWLEIHNAGAIAVNLSGWYLTDDDAAKTKWQFPSPTTIASGGFLVVFASDEDIAIPGQELHTNFKLSSGGDYLGLVAADGLTVVHEYTPSYPQQYPDVAYGLAFSGGAPTSQETYLSSATPGSANGSGGPLVFDVSHSPEVPRVTEPILVTATIVPPPGKTITIVYLQYRSMYTALLPVVMLDDGTGGDPVAGDQEFNVILPAGLAAPGEMIRWKIIATDSGLSTTKHPPFPHPTESPEFLGTIIDDPSITSPLPVYHWFVEKPWAASSSAGTRASLFHLGVLYDNVYVRPRGGTSLGYPKKSYKFDFNKGHHFQWDTAGHLAEEINLNTTWADKAFVRQPLSYETYQMAGVAGSRSFPVRVQRNGSFYSVAAFVEQPDEELLERNGLDPNGALYKMFNTLTYAYSGVEKKTRLDEDHSDLQALVNGVKLTGTPLDTYLFDNVDLPAVITYIAATTLIHDNDHVHKNYYLYRDSDGDGEWRFLPWDKDLTFGRNYTLSGGVLNDTMWADYDPYSHPLFGDKYHKKVDGVWNRLIDACHGRPRVREMYLRCLRTLMDEFLQPPSTPTGDLFYETWMDDLYNLMAADVALDQAKWGVPSWGKSSYTFPVDLGRIKTLYLAKRRPHLYVTHGPPGGLVPEEQTYPHVGFGAIEVQPASGNQDEEYIELKNVTGEAIDLSGWTLTGGVNHSFDPGSVIPSNDSAFVSPNLAAFRARPVSPTGNERRLVFGPYEGELSPGEEVHLGDPEGLVVQTTGSPKLVVRDLVPGLAAHFTIVGVASGSSTAFVLSLTGPGPTPTPYGSLYLSPPLIMLGIVPADASGTAEIVFTVPGSAAGLTVFCQGFDFTTTQLTNPVVSQIP